MHGRFGESKLNKLGQSSMERRHCQCDYSMLGPFHQGDFNPGVSIAAKPQFERGKHGCKPSTFKAVVPCLINIDAMVYWLYPPLPLPPFPPPPPCPILSPASFFLHPGMLAAMHNCLFLKWPWCTFQWLQVSYCPPKRFKVVISFELQNHKTILPFINNIQ